MEAAPEAAAEEGGGGGGRRGSNGEGTGGNGVYHKEEIRLACRPNNSRKYDSEMSHSSCTSTTIDKDVRNRSTTSGRRGIDETVPFEEEAVEVPFPASAASSGKYTSGGGGKSVGAAWTPTGATTEVGRVVAPVGGWRCE